MIITIITFLIILAILVFVHEFGHFIVARKSGMKVEEFGFGFPPRLAGIQKVDGKIRFVWGMKAPLDTEQTVYSINAIPLGGFVKILGENNEHESDPRSFINRPFWGRLLTLIAGVVMNVLLAWVLISVGFMFNLSTQIDSLANPPKHAIVSNPQLAVSGIEASSPAAHGGLLAGDIIEKIDGVSYVSAENAIPYIRSHAGKEMQVEIKRVTEIKELAITPQPNQDIAGQGYMGAELANIANLRYPWYYAIVQGANATVYQAVNIVVGLYGLITGHISLSNVGGPVQIAKLTGQARQLGFSTLLQFTAFLSINLAVLNILPFPALDGGRVLFLVIEKIRRKRNNQQIEQVVNTAGFVFLLLLMVLVTVKDVLKK